MEITREDAIFILGEEKTLDQCLKCEKCDQANCDHSNFKIYLNDIGDLLLRGECVNCKEPISKYIECGADYPSFRRANKIMINNIKK